MENINFMENNQKMCKNALLKVILAKKLKFVRTVMRFAQITAKCRYFSNHPEVNGKEGNSNLSRRFI